MWAGKWGKDRPPAAPCRRRNARTWCPLARSSRGSDSGAPAPGVRWRPRGRGRRGGAASAAVARAAGDQPAAGRAACAGGRMLKVGGACR
eukprot:362563-Chlamydomonas_euryale.AAC.3